MKKIVFLLGLVFILSSCWVNQSEEKDKAMMKDDEMMMEEEMIKDDEMMMEEEMMKDDEMMMEDKMMMEENMMMEDKAMMKDEDMMMKKENSMENSNNNEGMMMKDDEMMMKDEETPWNYLNYDSSLIWKTDKTVLFFHASWCPICRTADSNISSSDIPSWLTVLKVDYDKNTDLRKKYKVSYQHTFVQVDADWNLVNKWAWWITIEDIKENLK